MSDTLDRCEEPEASERLKPARADDASNRDVTWDVLSEKINDLIVLADVTGTIFYASPACKHLGYAQHELIGRTATDFVHPDDLDHFQANAAVLFGAAPAGGPIDREHRFRRGDGSWVWLEGNPSLINGPDGKPMGLVNVFRDVSEKHAISEALREQTRRVTMAEEIAGVGYWRFDAATRETSWSEQVFRHCGLAPDGLWTDADVAARIHPEDVAGAQERLNHAVDTGVGWSGAVIRIVRPDGEVRYLGGRAVCETGAAGRVVAVFGTSIDITEQKLAQQNIEASERRYRLLTEHATDIISQTASDGRMIYVSPSVERVTGFSVAEVLPRRMWEFVHPQDLKPFLAFYSDLISGRTEGGRALRYRVKHKDGSWMWLESNPRLVKSAVPGEPDDIIDVLRDVTEQQALSHQLREALALAEQAATVKSEFLANMSHEIRTPLTAVLGYTSLLSDRHDLDPKAQEQVERVAAAGRGLLAIVNDVLDFSKLEAGQTTITPSPTAAGPLAREVLEMFVFQAKAKALTLRFEAATEIPEFVTLDPDRLRQILVNLVGNGLKFTDRGSVTVRLAYDPATERLGIEVADTGPGISARAQAKLFQRFSQIDGSSTRSKGGTGLGLAICQGLAEAMGGSISLKSQVGRGSMFRLELPARCCEAPLRGDALSDCRDRLEGLRLLVIDDNAGNRDLVRAMLEPVGIEVSEACDGRDGVEVAGYLPVDLILMDIRMPGLDGRGAAAAIRNGDGPNRDVPILAFSAEDEGQMAQTENSGLFSGRVSKPLAVAELLGALHQAIAESAFAVEGELRHARL
jgi:PAS domain S-box-containing protein